MIEFFSIIHEDTDLLVVHKPADLVCHPTKGDEYSSLISRARIYLQRQASREGREVCEGILVEADSSLPSRSSRENSQLKTKNQKLKTDEPHLVNRLDRETSGLVVIAKNAAAAGELGKIWEARSVTKEYSAIVHGHVAAEHGVIDAPLGKDESSVVAIKDCVRADGTPAQTEFFVEKRFSKDVSCKDREVGEESAGESNPSPPSRSSRETPQLKTKNQKLKTAPLPFTLLRVQPRTGRKHQIRIHLQHLGHPIVGDKIYGGDSDLYLALVEGRLTDEQRERLILPSHALHAGRLQFHWRERDWEFTTPPEDFLREFCR